MLEIEVVLISLFVLLFFYEDILHILQNPLCKNCYGMT